MRVERGVVKVRPRSATNLQVSRVRADVGVFAVESFFDVENVGGQSNREGDLRSNVNIQKRICGRRRRISGGSGKGGPTRLVLKGELPAWNVRRGCRDRLVHRLDVAKSA